MELENAGSGGAPPGPAAAAGAATAGCEPAAGEPGPQWRDSVQQVVLSIEFMSDAESKVSGGWLP